MRARVLILLAAVALGLSMPGFCAPAETGHQTEDESEKLAPWKLVNFLLLAGVAGWFIAKNGGAFFNARSEQIRRGIAEASKIREEAEARYAEMEQRLAGLGAEIERLRRQAHEESAAEGERLRRQMEEDLGRIRTQAQQDIAIAGKAAQQELRAYSAELAVQQAEQKVRQRLTPDDDRALVHSAVNELAGRFQVQQVRPS